MMRSRNLYLLIVLLCGIIVAVNSKTKKNHARSTAAEDSHPPPEKPAPPAPEKKSGSSGSKQSGKVSCIFMKEMSSRLDQPKNRQKRLKKRSKNDHFL